MKKIISLLIIGFLAVSCVNQNEVNDVVLENTSWKKVKETWYYENENNEEFITNGTNQGYFIWDFEPNSIAKIHYEPYSISENAIWEKNQNILSIKSILPDESFAIKNYLIIEMTESYMKLNEQGDVNAESSINGLANDIIIELIKQ